MSGTVNLAGALRRPSRHEHPGAPPRSSRYLRDWVYGGFDGTVTTFAVVAGVAGADLSSRIVLILGFANLIADGFSMAAGNYSSTKADAENYQQLLAGALTRIEAAPEVERESLRRIYAAKGFEGETLDRTVQALAAERSRWVATMVLEQHGRAPPLGSPGLAAASTLAAFTVFGAVPLLPYIAGGAFPLSALLTALTFFGIGWLKSRWTVRPGWISGLETLAIGGITAALAYGVGHLMATLAG